MYETYLIGGLVLALLWWLTKPSERIKKYGDAIPGPWPYPIVGNALSVNLTGPKALKTFIDLPKKYKGTFRIYIGSLLSVFVSTPEDIEAILTDNDLITKSFPYKFLNSWLGTGLLTSTGEKWRARRKIITPTFHFKILEEFLSDFNKHATALVKSLENESGKGAFNLEMMLKKCALDIICETAMGSVNNDGEEYIHAVERICQVLSERVNKPWLFNPITYALSGGYFEEKKLLKSLRLITEKVIKEKTLQLKNNSDSTKNEDDFGIKKKTKFLEQLVKIRAESGNVFVTDDDIMEEVNTFMFAGHDTSTSTLCFALHLLAENPDVQEKLYDELDRLFQKDADFTREDLNEMKYLERVIKETFRIYPTVPFIGRTITKDIKLPSGYMLPKDAIAVININYIHKNEKEYENPEKFDPDNFLPEKVAKRHPFSFVPFSAGPRNCLGQKFAFLEMKTVLAKIILNFKVEPAGGDFKVMPDPKMVLRSSTGHKIKVSKRL